MPNFEYGGAADGDGASNIKQRLAMQCKQWRIVGAEPRRQTHFGNSIGPIENWLKIRYLVSDINVLFQISMFATISSSARIRRVISTRGRAITNNTKISMARAIVGNRATSGSDQRPMYDQLLRPTTDRTINRGDRSYDQS